VGLPAGWSGFIEVSSLIESQNHAPLAAARFAAVKDFDRALSLEQKYQSLGLQTATSEADVPSRTPWRLQRMARRYALKTLNDVALRRHARFLAAISAAVEDGTLNQTVNQGGNPAISPVDRIYIVSATQRPLINPSVVIDDKPRLVNQETVDLKIASFIDEKSTAEVSVKASWRRLQDDPASTDDPRVVIDSADVSTLKLPDPVTYNVTESKWEANWDLGTTEYRRVRYRLSALTRFTDFFPTSPRAALSCLGSNDCIIRHPNVAQPKPVEPRFLVPTLAWASGVEKLNNEPRWQFKSRSRYGIRVLLARGWELGQLLGVVTLPTLSEFQVSELNSKNRVDVDAVSTLDARFTDSVTRWGADPTVASQLPDTLPTPSDFTGFRRVGGSLLLPPLDELAETFDADGRNIAGGRDPHRRVSVVGYKPRWDFRRKLWYCDIGLSRIPSYGCFIRLALVRYQPNSLRDYELSTPVRADYVQLRPDRILTVMRDATDHYQRTIRIAISEPLMEGHTPLVSSSSPKSIRNRFAVHFEQLCRTTRDTPVGWVEDPTIVVDEFPAIGNGLLWTGTACWPRLTGTRRLVVREFETMPNGGSEREIYSNVLEI
jgi:hypothetical protein